MSDSFRNGRGIWNVRAIPRWQILCAGRPVMSSSWKRIEPAVGRSAPATRLKVVLLPDPFGPMRPTISPSRTSKDTRLTARKPPKRLESSVATSISTPTIVPSPSGNAARRECVADRLRAHGVDRGGGQRQDRLLSLDVAGPDHGDMLAGILHDDWRRSFVLAGELCSRRVELDAVALNRAPRRDVDVERGFAHLLRVEAAILLLGDRKHVVEQDPGLIEAHGAMRRYIRGIGLGLVPLDHHLGEIAQARGEGGRIEQLRRHRVDVTEIIDVVPEGRP